MGKYSWEIAGEKLERELNADPEHRRLRRKYRLREIYRTVFTVMCWIVGVACLWHSWWHEGAMTKREHYLWMAGAWTGVLTGYAMKVREDSKNFQFRMSSERSAFGTFLRVDVHSERLTSRFSWWLFSRSMRKEVPRCGCFRGGGMTRSAINPKRQIVWRSGGFTAFIPETHAESFAETLRQNSNRFFIEGLSVMTDTVEWEKVPE
jgi:hypothetical protein